MDIGNFYRTEDDVAIFDKMHRMAVLIDGLAHERETMQKRIVSLEEQLKEARDKEVQNATN